MYSRIKRVALAAPALLIVAAFQNCSPNPDVPLNNKTSSLSSAQTQDSSQYLTDCLASTINNCTLAAQPSGNMNGTCALGYKGSCSYSCNGGSWNSNANSCTAIDPLTLIGGTFVFHAGGNTGTITLQRSGHSISGTDNFPNWVGPGGVVGLTCADSGSVTTTSANSGTIQFSRTAPSGLSQMFTGTWTTTDFIHIKMSGDWYWQGMLGGSWDASN